MNWCEVMNGRIPVYFEPVLPPPYQLICSLPKCCCCSSAFSPIFSLSLFAQQPPPLPTISGTMYARRGDRLLGNLPSPSTCSPLPHCSIPPTLFKTQNPHPAPSMPQSIPTLVLPLKKQKFTFLPPPRLSQLPPFSTFLDSRGTLSCIPTSHSPAPGKP